MCLLFYFEVFPNYKYRKGNSKYMNIADIWQAVVKHLPFLFLGIGMVFGFYWLKNFKAFALWVKGGIEDGDHKLENKELQIAFFSLLSSFEVVMITVYDKTIPDTVVFATFGLAGLAYTANRGFEAFGKNGHNPKVESKSKPKNEVKSESAADDDGSYI